jgi:hypothetical protein
MCEYLPTSYLAAAVHPACAGVMLQSKEGCCAGNGAASTWLYHVRNSLVDPCSPCIAGVADANAGRVRYVVRARQCT